MPWIPIFVLALFVFHPLIGLAATLGATLIVGSTLLADRQSKRFVRRAAEIGTKRAALAESTIRNAEVIHSLGMKTRLTQEWGRLNQAYIAETLRMRDVEASIGTFAKILRFILQSAILGIGAALVIAEQADRAGLLDLRLRLQGADASRTDAFHAQTLLQRLSPISQLQRLFCQF